MDKKSQVDAAIADLAARVPLSEITLTVIAAKAAVSLPTLRRIVGGKKGLPTYVAQLGIELGVEDVQTPARLLSAAKRVFAKRGYEGASLDHVAAAAGMTKGAVYHHFKNKADLFWALAEERLSNQVTLADEANRVNPAWDETKLEGVLKQVLKRSAKEQGWARLHYEILSRTRDRDAKRHFMKQEAFLLKTLSETVKTAQESGEARNDIDPQAIALVIAAVIERLMQYDMLKVKTPNVEKLLPDIAKVLLGGSGTKLQT